MLVRFDRDEKARSRGWRVSMRLRAIGCALFYGVAPWWLYEDQPHYERWSYWRHLGINLCVATRWLTGRESAEDRRFEAEVNP
jgi:hypothetical protein